MTEVFIKVVARFRPINKRETEEAKGKGWSDKVLRPCSVNEDKTSVMINYGGRKPAQFTLDKFLGENTTQSEAFEVVALPCVLDCLQGINGCVFAYGQTGSGKTFSMFGPEVSPEKQVGMVELLGIIPQAATMIFEYLASPKAAQVASWVCDLSVMEIYVGDALRDLLHPRRKGDKKLKLRDGPRGVFVQGLKSTPVRTLTDVLQAIAIANKYRTTSSTKMNATSSRSHSVFKLKLKTELLSGSQRLSSLNFCDLAGSEKIGKTGAVGKQASEGMAINMSLTCLGRVINALVTHRDPPFRESALTHVLKDSLRGNCKTTILVCCSPHKFNVTETVNSLRFAMRAKLIKNRVKANKILSRQELQQRIKQLNEENKTLRDKLSGKVINTIDKKLVENEYAANSLFIKFAWTSRTLDDLPHGLNHAKRQLGKAIKKIGTEANLKNLKLNMAFRNEEVGMVIMIIFYENEYYNAKQLEDARDKIHKGLKGTENGIFAEADEDSVGVLSGKEQALLDAETQKIMMKELKALRQFQNETLEKLRRWDEERTALVTENGQLRFGMEQLDELAYAYDLEMADLQEKIEEQDDLITELETELQVYKQEGGDCFSPGGDVSRFKQTGAINDDKYQMPLVSPAMSISEEEDHKLSIFKQDQISHPTNLNEKDSFNLITPKPQKHQKSPRYINSPRLSSNRPNTIEDVHSLTKTPLLRTNTSPNRERSLTSPALRSSNSLNPATAAKLRLSVGAGSGGSNWQGRNRVRSVRRLLGPASTFAGIMDNDDKGDFPEDRKNVNLKDDEHINLLCRLFRSTLKKLPTSDETDNKDEIGSIHQFMTAPILTQTNKKNVEEKKVFMRVAVEMMEQLGAFKRERQRLNQELRKVNEETNTLREASEEMANEVLKYKNIIQTLRKHQQSYPDIQVRNVGTPGVNIEISGSDTPTERRSIPEAMCKRDKFRTNTTLLMAQNDALVSATRKSVHLSMLPSLFEGEGDEKSDDRNVLYKPDKNLDEWTIDDLYAWFSKFKGGAYEKYAKHMKEDDVDGECLLSLTRHELKHAYGMPRDLIRELYEEMFILDPLFKQKMQQRFYIKSSADVYSSADEIRPPTTIMRKAESEDGLNPSVKVVLGDVVALNDRRRGRVCFIGETNFGDGEWFGLELIEGKGEHDGHWKGKRYYRCQEDRGLFVKRKHINMVITNSLHSFSMSQRRLLRTKSYYQEMEQAIVSQSRPGAHWELSSSSDSETVTEQKEDVNIQVPAASSPVSIRSQKDLIVESAEPKVSIIKSQKTYQF